MTCPRLTYFLAISVSWPLRAGQAFTKHRVSPVHPTTTTTMDLNRRRSFQSEATKAIGDADNNSSNDSATVPASILKDKFKGRLDLHCVDGPISSTQDEIKRLLTELYEGKDDSEANDKLSIALLANRQLNGRGTQGRTWEGTQGNVYLTVAIPLDKIPVTITLFPLQIGVLIAQTLKDFLLATVSPRTINNEKYTTDINEYVPEIVVKWPNDVLVDDGKIAGVLIENWISPSSDDCWLLVGVGINVAFAPSLTSAVREARCLQDCYDRRRKSFSEKSPIKESGVVEDNYVLPESASRHVALALVERLLEWTVKSDDKVAMEAQVRDDFRSWAKFDQIYKIRETGEKVSTVGIQPDGQLRVRGADGQERDLVADYSF